MSSDDVKQITAQLQQIIVAVNAQNAILKEHVDCIGRLQRDLDLLRESQAAHGTELARIAKVVHAALHPEQPALTPVPDLLGNLCGGRR